MILDCFNGVEKKKILVYGDLIIDRYVTGDIERISQEAPVPILKYKTSKYVLGGCCNVINNIISLGGNARILGYVGDDERGKLICDFFDNIHVDTKYLFYDKNYKTTVKTRFMSQGQQILRVDEEEIKEPCVEFIENIKNNLDKILNDIDVLVICDYMKGAVNNQICDTLINEAKKRNIPIIVDPKGDNFEKYNGASYITPNLKELEIYSKKSIDTEADIIKYGKQLLTKCNIDNLILTRSEKGISYLNKAEKTKLDFPAKSKEVLDVTGAGDTIVATTSLLVAQKCKIEDICKLSNIAAGVVIGKLGTSVVHISEMKDMIEDKYNNKIIPEESIETIVNDLRKSGKKISFTNGCFDMLHAGHIDSLRQSRNYGDVLFVAVNSDDSVKKYKGDERPIISEEYRMMMLSSLECVDYIILMNDSNASRLVSIIKPDFYVKGEDYKGIETPESKIVNSYGGKCEYISKTNNISTTQIIEKVRRVYK